MHTDPITTPPAKRRKLRGPRELLADALLALANGKGRIANHSEKSWASITFAGARHRVEMVFEGECEVEAGECFIAVLPEHEFTIRGQLVADANIVEADSPAQPPRLAVTCEILLLEES